MEFVIRLIKSDMRLQTIFFVNQNQGIVNVQSCGTPYKAIHGDAGQVILNLLIIVFEMDAAWPVVFDDVWITFGVTL